MQIAQRIVGAAGLLGADMTALRESVGLSLAELSDADGWIAHASFRRLWDEAARLTGEASFGLRMAEMSRRAPDNALVYAVQSSPSVSEAIARSIRYSRLLHDSIKLALIVEGDTVRARLVGIRGLETSRQGIEFALGFLAMFCRQRAAGEFSFERARFRHAAPPTREMHDAVFAAPVDFRAEHDEVVFARRLLELPLIRPDPALCAYLDRHLDALLTRVAEGSDIRGSVRRAVGANLHAGVPDIEAIASVLGMSVRTVQRRLHASGVSFQSVVDELRRDLSIRYLRDRSIGIADVAFLVGFSDTASFYKAFKRWTGRTPAAARSAGDTELPLSRGAEAEPSSS